jgi:hypothetical protein
MGQCYAFKDFSPEKMNELLAILTENAAIS